MADRSAYIVGERLSGQDNKKALSNAQEAIRDLARGQSQNIFHFRPWRGPVKAQLRWGQFKKNHPVAAAAIAVFTDENRDSQQAREEVLDIENRESLLNFLKEHKHLFPDDFADVMNTALRSGYYWKRENIEKILNAHPEAAAAFIAMVALGEEQVKELQITALMHAVEEAYPDGVPEDANLGDVMIAVAREERLLFDTDKDVSIAVMNAAKEYGFTDQFLVHVEEAIEKYDKANRREGGSATREKARGKSFRENFVTWFNGLTNLNFGREKRRFNGIIAFLTKYSKDSAGLLEEAVKRVEAKRGLEATPEAVKKRGEDQQLSGPVTIETYSMQSFPSVNGNPTTQTVPKSADGSNPVPFSSAARSIAERRTKAPFGFDKPTERPIIAFTPAQALS